MELTREQIKEGNDKLAKLLGWYQDEKQLSFGMSEIWWENSDCAKYVAYSYHSNYPYRDLPFHRDWNYLMKVIDKIGYLHYHRSVDAPDYNWKEHYSYGELFQNIFQKWLRHGFEEHKQEFNLMNDLTSIWCGCVAWVDWYNSEENQKDE